MNLKFQETMKKYLNHILALFIALTALSSCSDDNEPSPVPEPDPHAEWLLPHVLHVGRRQKT